MRVRALFGETDKVWSHDKGFYIHIREWRGAGKAETKKNNDKVQTQIGVCFYALHLSFLFSFKNDL